MDPVKRSKSTNNTNNIQKTSRNDGARARLVKGKRVMSVNQGTIKRRQVMHDLIKTEIFNAVIDAMEKNNWSDISIDEIANEIGGSRGTVYHYFKNKGELMSAMWLYLHRMWTDMLAPIYHDANLEPAEKLGKYIYYYVLLTCRHWRMTRVIWTNAQSIVRWDNQTSQELLDERMQAVIAVRKMLAALRPDRQYPRDVWETEARAVLAYLDGTIIWYTEPCSMTPDEVARMITNNLMNGLKADWHS
jgi:AcrR family transcriptional regulator